MFRRWRDSTVVLEPLLQLAVSPNAKQIVVGHDPTTGAPVYLNEDSVAFEFDETNLFRANKFPGYDLYEDGARVNVAGRASVLWDDGRRASFLVGRSYRTGSTTSSRRAQACAASRRTGSSPPTPSPSPASRCSPGPASTRRTSRCTAPKPA